VGLLTAPLTLVRAPVRITLRAWELGLSTAAEAARIGMELLDPDRGARPADFARRSPAPPPEYVDNGSAPEPEVVVPETGYVAPEPGDVGPAPDVLDVDDGVRLKPDPEHEVGRTADAPPAVPDELIPDHVDEEPAEEGAGAELTIEPPWDGYDQMTAADIRDRLAAASPVEAGAVELYERANKNRSSVIDASERAQRR
jgi:hypothetical protein